MVFAYLGVGLLSTYAPVQQHCPPLSHSYTLVQLEATLSAVQGSFVPQSRAQRWYEMEGRGSTTHSLSCPSVGIEHCYILIKSLQSFLINYCTVTQFTLSDKLRFMLFFSKSVLSTMIQMSKTELKILQRMQIFDTLCLALLAQNTLEQRNDLHKS